MAEQAILAALQNLEQRQQQQANDTAAAIQALVAQVQQQAAAQNQTQQDLATALTTIQGFAANQQQQQAQAAADIQAATQQAAQAWAAAQAVGQQQQQQQQQQAPPPPVPPQAPNGPGPQINGAGPQQIVQRSLIDVKGVGKPTTFKGEEGKFNSWSLKTAFYFNGVYPGGKGVLQYCEHQADPIDLTDLNLNFPALAGMLDEMNESLYTLLGCTTEDDPQTIVLNAPEGAGFECWRRLARRYDLRTVARNRSMLAEIMLSLIHI